MTHYHPSVARGILLSLVFLLFTYASLSQKEKELFRPTHSIGINIGHEHSFSGRESVTVPYWGLDYNFQFAPKFAIGLHTDFITESFKVEKEVEGGETETIERSTPIAPALMGIYKPTEHWSFGVGMGGEFAKEKNYLLNRLSVDYGFEIKNAWEVFGALQYDVRWNAYDTWTIGLGIAKSFGEKRK